MRRSLLPQQFIRCLLLAGTILVAVGVLAACGLLDRETSTPVQEDVSAGMDEICRGPLDVTFESQEMIYLGDLDGNPIYGPMVATFLRDGRVILRDHLEARIGDYTCADGHFTASFGAPDSATVEAEYDPQNSTMLIDNLTLVPDSDV